MSQRPGSMPGGGQPEAPSGPRNRLAGESSPYLLLHQTNPVDWYPWSEEAFAEARAKDCPIFLSVGYSTCYWCHVMERESFSDPEIAELLNRSFVNVKVDREERPDLDEIYMTATQILTGQGGWPNSVFLTPDLKPFYAGTYFPPRDRWGRPGFGSLVLSLADAWKSRRGQLLQHAEDLAGAMRKHLEERAQPSAETPGPEHARRAVAALGRRFDAEWGGFSGAPKFPSPANLFLLQALAAEDAHAAQMLTTTLDQMARGGIYDQLAGGFHRYATDREWRVPHFEKMLYDNGLLLEVYARELLRTDEPEWARIVDETAAFLGREMTAPEGALWSAIDAETGGHEGAFYVWTRAEIEAALGAEDAAFLAPLLGYEGPPFFEDEHYVLHLPQPLAELAAARRQGRDQLLAEIAPLRQRLLAARGERERPKTDDKVLTDWNGTAIAGLAVAGRARQHAGMVAQAAAAARFLLAHLRPAGGPLLHAYRAGEAKIPAYLADYAFFVHGLLALAEAGAGVEFLTAARELVAEQASRLESPDGGFFNAAAGPDLLFRSQEVFDGALPAANAMAILNLLDLATATGEVEYARQAERHLGSLGAVIERLPDGARMLALAAYRLAGPAGGDAPAVPPDDLAALAERVVASKLEVAPAAEPGSSRSFRLRLTIAPRWHVNANPVGEPGLVPTRLMAEGATLRVEYPPPATLPEAPGLAVWAGEVELRGDVTQQTTEAGLWLEYQACDAGRCLAPVRRWLALPNE